MLWRLHRFKGVPWVVCSGNVGEVDAPSLPDPLLTGSGVLAVLGCPFLPPARGGLFSVIRLRGGVLGGRRGWREARGRMGLSGGGVRGGRRLGGRRLFSGRQEQFNSWWRLGDQRLYWYGGAQHNQLQRRNECLREGPGVAMRIGLAHQYGTNPA